MPRPPYAERLRSARERVGLTAQALSDQLGWGQAGLWDLEAYDGDLPMTVSIRDIGRLCDALQIDPVDLLAASGVEAASARPRLGPLEVVNLVRDHLATLLLTPAAFGDQVGWEVAPILADPQALWDLNADGLHDICSGIGLNWLRALPPSSTSVAV